MPSYEVFIEKGLNVPFGVGLLDWKGFQAVYRGSLFRPANRP